MHISLTRTAWKCVAWDIFAEIYLCLFLCTNQLIRFSILYNSNRQFKETKALQILAFRVFCFTTETKYKLNVGKNSYKFHLHIWVDLYTLLDFFFQIPAIHCKCKIIDVSFIFVTIDKIKLMFPIDMTKCQKLCGYPAPNRYNLIISPNGHLLFIRCYHKQQTIRKIFRIVCCLW
jgi:hypothetical protein